MSTELERARQNICEAFCTRGRFASHGPIATEFSALVSANLALVREETKEACAQIADKTESTHATNTAQRAEHTMAKRIADEIRSLALPPAQVELIPNRKG